jgi:CRISPR/Cas system-associated endoribonuclease Cas2
MKVPVTPNQYRTITRRVYFPENEECVAIMIAEIDKKEMIHRQRIGISFQESGGKNITEEYNR